MNLHQGEALRRLSDYFRAMIAASDAALRIPLFSILVDAEDDNPYRNYAYPDDGAAPDADSIGRLVDAFVSRDRTPRLEYIPALAPLLHHALERAGFRDERLLPLMACTPETIDRNNPPPDIVHRFATFDDDLAEAARIQNVAYGAGEATTSDLERLRRLIARGGAIALAERAGEAVGSGLVTAPIGGVAEVAAVGVVPEARGQGIGGSLTAFLAREALARGIDLPFLMAAHDDEARLYRSRGFWVFATMLHTSQVR